MEHGIYAIYDKVAKAIVGGLHMCLRDEVAIRMFSDVASDDQTLIARHPLDYELVKLGVIGDTCVILECDEPVVVLTGSAFVAMREARAAKEVVR